MLPDCILQRILDKVGLILVVITILRLPFRGIQD